MYLKVLFDDPGHLDGQAPSHASLRPFLVLTQKVLPSILPLEGGICAHFL